MECQHSCDRAHDLQSGINSSTISNVHGSSIYLKSRYFWCVCETGILKSTCYIDVRWFPFDVQKCDLKFGSWTHNGWLLDLQMREVDISTYIPNGEWDLVGETENTHTHLRSLCTRPFFILSPFLLSRFIVFLPLSSILLSLCSSLLISVSLGLPFYSLFSSLLLTLSSSLLILSVPLFLLAYYCALSFFFSTSLLPLFPSLFFFLLPLSTVFSSLYECYSLFSAPLFFRRLLMID